jgi:phosphate starvation-inducible PhoH-like protein
MITRKIILKDINETLIVLGPQDIYLRELEKDFGVKIYVEQLPNSTSLIIKGKQRSVSKTISRIESVLKKYYEMTNHSNKIEEESEITNTKDDSDTIYTTEVGEKIKPKTENQKNYVKKMLENDIVIAIGPAGTGKTFLAATVGLKLLKEKRIKKIVITRPIVEAGEHLGFLPGDIESKVNPYLKPVYDVFYNLLGPEKFHIYREEDIIETVPLAYMRGRTLEDSFIILDEAQNTTTVQMKMFLTRMGFNSKIVVTGDITQIDLKEKNTSGLITSIEILKDIEEIKIVVLTNEDIIRHPIITKIIDAYKKWEDNQNGNKYYK